MISDEKSCCVVYNQFESITRLKFQLDGGQQFLKMSVNIISVITKSHYLPNPNSVLTNFVIAIGQAPETHNNLREMFNYPSIFSLFDIGIPKQIACDFKVAALLVGIQQAQSKHPCPYCLWRKGDPCTGKPAKARSYDGVKMWNLRFKTRETNQALYSQRLIDCMVTYNYNLNWDDVIRGSQKESSSSENTVTPHDEVELMDNINSEDDDRIQPHNWDTDNSDDD